MIKDQYITVSAAAIVRVELLSAEAITQIPAMAQVHAGLALAYFQKSVRYAGGSEVMDLAVQSAHRAITIDPSMADGHGAMGLIQLQQGHIWAALSEFHLAIELKPQNAQAMRYFGTAWAYVGQPQFGLPWAQEAVRMEPTNTGACKAAADACVDLCADDQTLEFYRRCLLLNPKMLAAHCGIMHISLLHGDFKAARREGAVAEAIEPGSELLLSLKAQIELFGGNYGEAEPLYRRLLEMNRRGALTYYGGISYLTALAFLRQEAGDAQEAESLLEEVSRIHSDQRESEGPMDTHDLAALRSLQGRPQDALSLLGKSSVAGWIDYRATRLDPRFRPLHGDPAFGDWLGQLRAQVKRKRRDSELLCTKPIRIEDYPVQARSW